MIKAIVFDFGGVFNSANRFSDIGAMLASKIGLSAEEGREIVQEEWTLCKIGRLSCDKFFRNLGHEFGMTAEEIRELIYLRFKYNEKVINLVPKLAKKYSLFLFSNIIEDWFKFHKKNLGLDYFEDVFLSCREGMAKPEPKFYSLVHEKIGLKPEEILFIDDKLYNLKPARELGWNVIQFQGFEQFKEELKNL